MHPLRSVERTARNRILGRKRYQPAFRFLHRVALAGMNFGADDLRTSGELCAMDLLARHWRGRPPVVFDVGANVGDYAAEILRRIPNAKLHCFEPSPTAFERLEARLGSERHVRLHPFGLGADNERVTLYADAPASGLASVYRRRLDHVGIVLGEETFGELRRLADVCDDEGIETVDLLKLDVEGSELAVLLGAADRLTDGSIGAIQFEFGGADIDARVFFRDLYERLSPHYAVHRVLRDGLQEITRYCELDEIFVTSNFLCLGRIDY